MRYIITMFLLAGCGALPPQIISGDQNEVAIQMAGMGLGNPGEMAARHCGRYDKRAVLRIFQSTGAGSRGVYYFECRE